MPRKAKKYVHPMPPLGWRDKILYWCAMLLTGGGSLFLLFYQGHLCNQIAFADDRAVAYHSNSSGFVWLVFWLMMVFALIALCPYRNRYPIFGNSQVKYGPPAWPRVYPLLMQDKPKHWVSPRDVTRKKWKHSIITAILMVTLIPGLILYPRSANPRTVLLRDGTVAVYDVQNREEYHCKFSQITNVRVETYWVHKKGLDKKSVEMVIETEQTSFSFTVGSFGGDWEAALQTMLKMKALYGNLITIEQDADLVQVVRRNHLDSAEEALLHELFS